MKKFSPKNDLPIMSEEEGVVLFYPHIPASATEKLASVLSSRWIGQGPLVDKFEKEFGGKFNPNGASLAVSSGTSALHLSYLLAGINSGDEVICPLFTCTATNIPLLYLGAKPVFADIDPETLNISPQSIRSKISERTKAIVVVHYGGLPCDMDEILSIAREFNLLVIEDAAHALGATYDGKPIGSISDFTMFSFQAIKHITTGDGGMLCMKDPNLFKLSSRLRWFGIDRSDKQRGIWENDIREIGYKYQMTDISASLGLAGLEDFGNVLSNRRKLWALYDEMLRGIPGLRIVKDECPKKRHAAWLFTVLVEDRVSLQEKLRRSKIESGQTHYRNDRYTIFADQGSYPAMDSIDDKYLVLPLHTKLTEESVDRVCRVIQSGW